MTIPQGFFSKIKLATGYQTTLFDWMTLYSLNPPPLQRGGIEFLKFGNKGGDEIFFLEREGLC